MTTKLTECPECNGTGDCANHEETYIDVDISLPCEYCQGKRLCPRCNGMGEITEEFHEYLNNPSLDPRD